MGKLVTRLKNNAGDTWEAYIHHPWIEGMYNGDLSNERLQFFLVQDLPYVAEFSRVYFMAFAKLDATELRIFRPFLQLIAGYDEGHFEEDLLAKLDCNDFSSDRWAALKAREGYINHLIRTAYEGTALEIFSATLPCSLGFAEIGERFQDADLRGHREILREWIEQYHRPFQREQVNALIEGLEECAARLSEAQLLKLERLFVRSVQHQVNVFDAAWRMDDPWPGPGSYVR